MACACVLACVVRGTLPKRGGVTRVLVVELWICLAPALCGNMMPYVKSKGPLQWLVLSRFPSTSSGRTTVPSFDMLPMRFVETVECRWSQGHFG